VAPVAKDQRDLEDLMALRVQAGGFAVYERELAGRLGLRH
jgi:hypothetical protein